MSKTVPPHGSNAANSNLDGQMTGSFDAQRPTDDDGPQAPEGSRFTYPLPGPGGRLANS